MNNAIKVTSMSLCAVFLTSKFYMSRLALVGAFAGVFFATNARAERACLEDPAITGRTCSAAECIALHDEIERICKKPPPRRCEPGDCDELRKERKHWLDCYIARVISNERCWNGGDQGHQIAAADAIMHVGKCDAIIALPRAEGGCASNICP